MQGRVEKFGKMQSLGHLNMLLLLLFILWFQVGAGSYLQLPRINFKGRFRADVATSNNERMNFLFASIAKNEMINNSAGTFNPAGTNSWAMVDCVVTSTVCVDNDVNPVGVTHKSTDEDVLVGLPLVNNPDTPSAKLVDIDVDDQLVSSTIYGMQIGINWDPLNPNQPNWFFGDFMPTVVSSDVWVRQAKEVGAKYQQTLGTRSVSKITNVKWSNKITSPTLLKLKKEMENTGKEELSIRFALYNYNKNSEKDWFLYGNLVGSIGVAQDDEALQFPENRVMPFFENPPHLPVKDKDCENIGDWMHGAYFDVDLKKSIMQIDMSNSFAIGVQGNICDLYSYYVGILKPATSDTVTAQVSDITNSMEVKIIAEVPYLGEWYYTSAAIMDIKLTEDDKKLILEHQKIVVVVAKTELKDVHPPVYPLCKSGYTAVNSKDSECVYVLLKEAPCLIRPMGIFNFRLEKEASVKVALKMKYFGEVPKSSKTVQIHDTSPNAKATFKDLLYQNTVETNSETGIAVVTFTAGNVGEPRKDIRLDGQVFTFGYCSHNCDSKDDVAFQLCKPTNEGNYLVFLIWSPVKYTYPYFWDTHVQPIFEQYENLYPAMSAIVKLGHYDDVTKPQNILLIKTAMTLPETHPSYMPVTRDLPPAKRSMILQWLDTPNHPRNWQDIDYKLFQTPAFCNQTFMFSDHDLKQLLSGNDDNYFGYHNIIDSEGNKLFSLDISDIARSFSNIAKGELQRADNDIIESATLDEIAKPDVKRAITPLWTTNECTLDNLKYSLQTAIALEFSTIPPYMTALYSIKDSYNQEVYETIRSVVMQEMLHMAQAANLLISIGGNPQIENPENSYIPKCFPSRLPGGVLPNLLVTLKKASPQHIQDVFMMIEYPDKVVYKGEYHEGEYTNDLTIGAFYTKIQDCMDSLNEDGNIFVGKQKQIKWPWKMYDKSSKLYQVTNNVSANAAINMIVEQGEGAEQQDPTYLGTQKLAHFFKFGEAACKQRLNATYQKTYSYSGEEMEFVSEGVWPMRDNPVSESIPPNTRVYHEAKDFHRLYRSLLNAIQKTFNGDPDALKEAVYVMEAMQIQAKKLMQMEIPAQDGHTLTCGPIFDYEWGKCKQVTPHA